MIDFIRNVLDTLTFAFSATVFFLLGYRLPWNKTGGTPQKASSQDIPGPPALPILGTSWLFLFGGWSLNKLHLFSQHLYQKYGPVVKEEALFNVPVINIFERQDIEKVLKCHSKYPFRPPVEALAYYRRSRRDRYASTGLVNEQGQQWYHLRTSLTPDIASPKTIASFLKQAEEIADEWCDLLSVQRTSTGDVNNLLDLAGRLGLEVSCAFILGQRMGFLLPGKESDMAKKFATAVQNHFLATRDIYFGLPLWKLFNTSSYRLLVQSEETIYELASKMIANADEDAKESAVLHSILSANIDEREKTAAIIDFIAAGIHTLKNSLIFLLHLVAAQSKIQEKICEDETKNYVKACINESFRYLPTANALARIAEQELDLSGYKIKAGSIVVCHNAIACRDERNFKEANTFRPERWLGEEKSQTVSKSAYLVAPFGVGRRLCPGKRFIEHILPIFLEKTVQKYHMTVPGPLDVEFEFLMCPKSPVIINFQDRY